MPRLENWSIVSRGNGHGLRLAGTVYDHTKLRHPDGKAIITGVIDGAEGGLIKTRSGSLYSLGEPHPDYEKAFPGAKERVMTAARTLEAGRSLDLFLKEASDLRVDNKKTEE